VEFRGKVPAKHSFSQFPLQIGEWSGTRETMEQAFIDELDLSDYVIVNYRNKQNNAINFYTAYYESQQKGESIHSPETCLPGSGWKFGKEEEVSFKTKNGGAMRVNRVFMEKDGEKQLAYFWFPQRGRVLTKLYQLKLYNFWDALTRQRTDGALIRVITPIGSTEKPEDAELRIRDFLNDTIPILSSFIPN
jgi:EpsI family protein